MLGVVNISSLNSVFKMVIESIVIVAFLYNAAIVYSSESVFVCFCTILQKMFDLGTQDMNRM